MEIFSDPSLTALGMVLGNIRAIHFIKNYKVKERDRLKWRV